MKRLVSFAIAVALTAAFTTGAWSQGGQAGGGGTAGTSGSAGTSVPPTGTNAPAAAGAAGQAQAGAGAGQNPAAANLQAQSQLGPQGPGFNQVSRTPFFNDLGVRQQLNLNNNQFNQLNRAYQDAFARYTQGVSGLDNRLTDQQRMQQLQQLQARFNQNLGSTLDTTFTDPQLRQRYNQLNLQFQGPQAFSDPMVRRQLNLTEDQELALRRLSAGWRRSLAEMRQSAGGDPRLSQQQWSTFQRQYQNQLATILTPAQQQAWTQLVGQPYDFPVSSYLPPGANTPVQPGQFPQTTFNQQGQPQQPVPQGTQSQGTQNRGTVR